VAMIAMIPVRRVLWKCAERLQMVRILRAPLLWEIGRILQ
jgi:hypothetical protein